MQLAKPESVGLSGERLGRIGQVMQGYLDREQLAGMITLVARRGQVVHLEAKGYRDREAGQPMALDSLFRIYSMTKPITSTGVMILLEEGHFQLTDPISRFIPAFKEVKVYQPRGAGGDYDLVPPEREITIRDLLTHTAGLSYGFDDHSAVDAIYRKQLWGKVEKDPEIDLAGLMDALTKLPLAYHPGKAWRYSVAIDVLGRLIEVVSGLALDEFLRSRIFYPLGMLDTGFSVPDEKLSRLAVVYEPAKKGGIQPIKPQPFPSRWFSGGGGLYSTILDYYRFSQMILNKGALEGARILSPKTVELMLHNHLPKGVIRETEPYEGFGLGGLVLVDPPGSQMLGSVGSWGWSGAANTWFRIDPQEAINMILMVQFMPPFTSQVERYFSNMVYQSIIE